MTEMQHAIAQALQHHTAQGTGRRGTMPAPVRGLNTRDPEANMHPAFAITLDNWFAESGVIRTRAGSRVFAETGAGTPIQTLVSQVAGAEKRLFAVSETALFNVSDPDEDDPAVGITEVVVSTAITSGRWRSANLGGHVVMVNGIDEPIRIDAAGDAEAHGFSGATGHPLVATTLSQVVTHQNRLFFTAADSTKLWYGDLRAITGELSSIDLGLVSASGGNLAAVGSVTLDTGQGVNDLLAVISTRGAVYLYAGTDPASANSWSLQGVFQIGAPVGNKPLLQLGGDLIVITVDGFVPLLQFIRGGRSQTQYALSDPIGSLARDAARDYSNVEGWEAVLHAPAGWILFNTPRIGAAYQLVMNSQTKAWCRFVGMPAQCWATWKDRIFFGAADGKIWEANVGSADGENPIRVVLPVGVQPVGDPVLEASPPASGSRRVAEHGACLDRPQRGLRPDAYAALRRLSSASRAGAGISTTGTKLSGAPESHDIASGRRLRRAVSRSA